MLKISNILLEILNILLQISKFCQWFVVFPIFWHFHLSFSFFFGNEFKYVKNTKSQPHFLLKFSFLSFSVFVFHFHCSFFDFRFSIYVFRLRFTLYISVFSFLPCRSAPGELCSPVLVMMTMTMMHTTKRFFKQAYI